MAGYLAKEGQFKAGIRLDEINEVLCAQTTEELADVRPDEGVIHDGGTVVLTIC